MKARFSTTIDETNPLKRLIEMWTLTEAFWKYMLSNSWNHAFRFVSDLKFIASKNNK